MGILDKKTIVIGVTGGIAAYKACEIVSSLKKLGADVHVVMTKNALQFVSSLTFETLSGNRAITDMFDRDYTWEVEHISLAKKADIIAVAPATANLIGKIAGGIADDFLSTTIMAAKCPVLFAPAMNTNMYQNPIYKGNETKLKGRGYKFVTPDTGRLACGDIGVGKLAPVEMIVDRICAEVLPKSDFAGKTIMVTAGGTSEPLDPVRSITNRSSGKMGAAIALSAEKRGAKVIYIMGSVTDPYRSAYKNVSVSTTEEMRNAVLENIKESDALIMAAAPSDYRIKNYSAQKIKGDAMSLELVKNPDIAKEAAGHMAKKPLVIFAAETNDLEKNALEKLKSKGADMVVANDVTKAGAGFGTDTNIATLFYNDKKIETGLVSKLALADKILDGILEIEK